MKKLTMIAFIVLGASTSAFSQVEKGDINLSGSLTFQKFSDIDGSGLFDAKAGYFFSQNIEAGANMSIIFSEATALGFGPYASYNFLTEDAKLLPYVGTNLLFITADQLSVTALGVNGGAKYFLTEIINVDASMSLQKAFGDLDGTLFVMRVGIGFLLGKVK
jgi:hypothetical protein